MPPRDDSIVRDTPSLLNGLYKVEYGVNDAFGRSIMCMHNGKLLGGNSAFAHLGTYQRAAGKSSAKSSPSATTTIPTTSR